MANSFNIYVIILYYKKNKGIKMNDTFKLIWITYGFEENYYVVQSKNIGAYYAFIAYECEEVSYTNFIIKSNYTKLNGKFLSNDGLHYIIVKDNIIHCETGPAIRCPFGIDSFRVGEDVEDYLLHGQVFSEHSWLSWLKDTEMWPYTVAHMLGSKDL
jgi:hypothetical protein